MISSQSETGISFQGRTLIMIFALVARRQLFMARKHVIHGGFELISYCAKGERSFRIIWDRSHVTLFH